MNLCSHVDNCIVPSQSTPAKDETPTAQIASPADALLSPRQRSDKLKRSIGPNMAENGPLLPKSPAKQFLAKERKGMRSSSNKENMGPEASASATPSSTHIGLGIQAESSQAGAQREGSPEVIQRAPMTPTPQDPIEAMDAVAEAVELVENAIPRDEDIVSPKKVVKMTTANGPPPSAMKPARRSMNISSATPRKSTNPRQAPLSNGVKRTESVKKPRPRASSVRKPDTTAKDPAGKADIPHSKPRPISMSFPTPPPPAKSSKPSTRPTFQLPGEAVAAKLKAAKEERQKKEEEEAAKRPAFKARPAPKMKEGGGAVVRPTAASRARESLMLGKDQPTTNGVPAGPSGMQRSTSVRESLLKDRASRMSTMTSSRMSTVTPRPTPAAGRVAPKPRPTSMIITSRPSTIAASNQANTSRPRTTTNEQTRSKPRPQSMIMNSTIETAFTAPTTTTNGSTTQKSSTTTSKGKAVFARHANEREEQERKKREKEEAAKKARAAAAEKGRVASREWARRMKDRLAGGSKKGGNDEKEEKERGLMNGKDVEKRQAMSSILAKKATNGEASVGIESHGVQEGVTV